MYSRPREKRRTYKIIRERRDGDKLHFPHERDRHARQDRLRHGRPRVAAGVRAGAERAAEILHGRTRHRRCKHHGHVHHRARMGRDKRPALGADNRPHPARAGRALPPLAQDAGIAGRAVSGTDVREDPRPE